MGLIILLIIGAIVGWLASIIARRDSQEEILLHVVAGMTGAIAAGLVVSGTGFVHALSVSALVASFLGATGFVTLITILREKSVLNR